jgi:Domain of unknown function (DUF6089)
MKRLCVIVSVAGMLLLQTTLSKAQYYFYNDKYYAGDLVVETGSSAGLMNSLTDLGGRKGIGKNFIKDLNWKVTEPDFSIYIIAMYRDAIGFRLESTKGRIRSSDQVLKKTDPDLTGRFGRNLSFRSSIIDFQFTTETHPLFFKSYEEDEAPFWSPYIVAGVGYFSFNPQANLQGRWQDLQPLHLEGQGFAEYPYHKPYQLSQFNIPLGIGIKYEIGSTLSARLEIVHRLLFTDYLDDVSTAYIDPSLFARYLHPELAEIAQQLYNRMKELQPVYIVKNGMQRGDPTDNDAFFSIQLKIGWVIRRRIK